MYVVARTDRASSGDVESLLPGITWTNFGMFTLKLACAKSGPPPERRVLPVSPPVRATAGDLTAKASWIRPCAAVAPPLSMSGLLGDELRTATTVT
jgi:hypothetical protein